MRVPTINELQDLWAYKRVNQHYDEHRPAPDHSLFIAEFRAAIEKIKADAWDEGNEVGYEEGQRAIDFETGFSYRLPNPYRKQEEA